MRQYALFFYAYLEYAHTRTNMYDFIMYVRMHECVGIDKFSDGKSTPMIKALASYEINKSELVHCHRLLRCILHGFITQERIVFFQYSSDSLNESYKVALNCFLDDIHKVEKRGREK